MSQVFSGDSVTGAAGAAVPQSGETVVLTGNFLNPPFGNAKSVVSCFIAISPGPGTTSLNIRLRRNPTAENVQVISNAGVNVSAGVNAVFSLQGADAIPDGRPVQYAITVTPTGATGASSVVGANVTAFLISG